MARPKFIAAGVFLAALCAGSAAGIFDTYENESYDWRSRVRGTRPVDARIAFIDIWDDSLQALGAWPFARSYHADLIRTLADAGAAAVAFDVLFVEPREGDDEVIAAAREAGNVYFIEAFADIHPAAGGFEADTYLAPLLPGYAAAARGVGHVNPHADSDGKMRRVFPLISHRGHPRAHLGLKLAADTLGVPETKLRLPLDERGRFIVSYAGRWGEDRIPHYSYLEIILSGEELRNGRTPRVDLTQLRGRICLVGLTSLGSHDTKPVPIQSVYPMVGMHASTLNTVLKKDFIRRPPRAVNVIILAAMMALVLALSFRLAPRAALGAVSAALAAFAAVATGLFLLWGIWLDLVYPVVVSVLVYAISTLNRVLAEMRRRQLIEKELEIASKIQQSFLPQSLPEQKGLDLAVHMKPAKAVGGDLYTFVPLGGDRIGVMIGDVSGKGTPAALFMAKTVSEFKYAARDKTDPAEVLTGLNDAVSTEATGGLFVTVSYVILDLAGGRLTLANGGHLPMVAVSASGASELLTTKDGMPIGVMEGMPFSNLTRALEAGDVLALYTDGVTEARNKRSEDFTDQRLREVLVAHRKESAARILEAARTALELFVGRADPHDDMTLIILKKIP
ncbi:MAG: hypothetical protein A3D28_03415 [Omnitrophica bacterium RIFCSPHIGHO2_02_FULL_63_14]|nr:MAG: hypothetical protein A3D28_03415 [Omnitrophica bacterium RIFCSPHIGHO2_02_FULL_63_14]